MKRSFLILMLTALAFTACGQNIQQSPQPAVQPVKQEDQLLQDIGEMLLVGFRGTTLKADNHIIRDIQQYHVGSVILFEYDAPTGTRHRTVLSPSSRRSAPTCRSTPTATCLSASTRKAATLPVCAPATASPPP